MKTWEMIKELTENPNKKFKNKKDGYKVQMINGLLVYPFYNSEHELQSSDWFLVADNALEMEWKEVKEPVTWQEAIEAWIDGKTIYCLLNGEKFIYERSPLRKSLYDTEWKSSISAAELMNGDWYIED